MISLQGYMYAGMRNGLFCDCGDNDYTAATASEACVFPCPGNREEVCGAAAATSIHKARMYQISDVSIFSSSLYLELW